ncbi:MAG TPA: hypothetical protein VK961_27810 [Chthoniobacter sp.]|nr:hypothetical protein [Chthoniobacter sp.]
MHHLLHAVPDRRVPDPTHLAGCRIADDEKIGVGEANLYFRRCGKSPEKRACRKPEALEYQFLFLRAEVARVFLDDLLEQPAAVAASTLKGVIVGGVLW